MKSLSEYFVIIRSNDGHQPRCDPAAAFFLLFFLITRRRNVERRRIWAVVVADAAVQYALFVRCVAIGARMVGFFCIRRAPNFHQTPCNMTARWPGFSIPFLFAARIRITRVVLYTHHTSSDHHITRITSLSGFCVLVVLLFSPTANSVFKKLVKEKKKSRFIRTISII